MVKGLCEHCGGLVGNAGNFARSALPGRRAVVADWLRRAARCWWEKRVDRGEREEQTKWTESEGGAYAGTGAARALSGSAGWREENGEMRVR